MKSYFVRLGSALLGIILFVALAVGLEQELGIPFAMTFRVACAGACLIFIIKTRSDYPGERWPLIAFFVAFLFNVSLFFSPLAHLPASKGDLLFFAVPDAVIVLTARAISYPVSDVHERAVRQQLIVGIIMGLAFCGMILGLMFIPPHSFH